MPHGDLINNISRRLLWEHQQEIPWERVTVVGEGPWIFLQGEKYEMLFESHVVQYSTVQETLLILEINLWIVLIFIEDCL